MDLADAIEQPPHRRSTVPDAAADGLGRLHVVWQDDGNGTKDIRYRRVEANGSLSTEFTAGNLGDDRSPRVAANAGGGVSLVWNVWNASNQASKSITRA